MRGRCLRARRFLSLAQIQDGARWSSDSYAEPASWHLEIELSWIDDTEISSNFENIPYPLQNHRFWWFNSTKIDRNLSWEYGGSTFSLVPSRWNVQKNTFVSFALSRLGNYLYEWIWRDSGKKEDRKYTGRDWDELRATTQPQMSLLAIWYDFNDTDSFQNWLPVNLL